MQNGLALSLSTSLCFISSKTSFTLYPSSRDLMLFLFSLIYGICNIYKLCLPTEAKLRDE